MKFIGIDGCKAGWVYLSLDVYGNYRFGVVNEINQLKQAIKHAEITLIDIPIGLRGSRNGTRLCDKQARAVLARGRKSSVFSPPCRAAINADSYAEANALNRLHVGKGLSAQCYGIVPKISEVDLFLSVANPDQKILRDKIREMHPEVAFWSLNEQQPMLHSKKTQQGFEERLQTLSRHYQNSAQIIELVLQQYPRKQLARDDIVDALVGAVMARYNNELISFPALEQRDETGLVMEIVYWGGSRLNSSATPVLRSGNAAVR